MVSETSPRRLRQPSAEQQERLFFLVSALVIGATVLIAFGLYIVLGMSSFDSPWWVHVHGVSFMAWIGLYFAQNLLVSRHSIEGHRQLGRLGAFLALWMVFVGLALTPATLAADRIPPDPVFTPSFFLALDWVNITCFAGLVFSALYLRERTDWHRRLMLCATICVIAPAWGRLLGLVGAMTEWNNIGVLLIYVAIAIVVDWRIRGRVHAAYLWGGGAIFVQAPAITLLSSWSSFDALAMRIAQYILE